MNPVFKYLYNMEFSIGTDQDSCFYDPEDIEVEHEGETGWFEDGQDAFEEDVLEIRGEKFSVTSVTLNMGCSVEITFEDGVTPEDIPAIYKEATERIAEVMIKYRKDMQTK
jgi:hypothetical protein